MNMASLSAPESTDQENFIFQKKARQKQAYFCALDYSLILGQNFSMSCKKHRKGVEDEDQMSAPHYQLFVDLFVTESNYCWLTH